jgi:hypothetical protein
MAANFERAIELLLAAEVDFIVIGGFSAILHGSSYITQDLDIMYSRETANLRRLADVLKPFHPRPVDMAPELPFVWDWHTLQNGSLFTLTSDLGRIDLLAEVSGLGSYLNVYAKSIEAELYGKHVRTLDLRSLIDAKRAAGRVKDLQILPELESLLEASED